MIHFWANLEEPNLVDSNYRDLIGQQHLSYCQYLYILRPFIVVETYGDIAQIERAFNQSINQYIYISVCVCVCVCVCVLRMSQFFFGSVGVFWSSGLIYCVNL